MTDENSRKHDHNESSSGKYLDLNEEQRQYAMVTGIIALTAVISAIIIVSLTGFPMNMGDSSDSSQSLFLEQNHNAQLNELDSYTYERRIQQVSENGQQMKGMQKLSVTDGGNVSLYDSSISGVNNTLYRNESGIYQKTRTERGTRYAAPQSFPGGVAQANLSSLQPYNLTYAGERSYGGENVEIYNVTSVENIDWNETSLDTSGGEISSVEYTVYLNEDGIMVYRGLTLEAVNAKGTSVSYQSKQRIYNINDTTVEEPSWTGNVTSQPPTNPESTPAP